MRIDGLWLVCDDGVTRPVLAGEVLSAAGTWEPIRLLVDTGADRTVLSPDVFQILGLAAAGAQQLVGLGGAGTATVLVNTSIRFFRDGGTEVLFRGRYAACTASGTLDMSVLGRDLLDLFAVIVDHPGDTVCLLHPNHFYSVFTP